jgi:hypothetical protein
VTRFVIPEGVTRFVIPGGVGLPGVVTKRVRRGARRARC